MKVAVFSSKTYDKQTLTHENAYANIELDFFESRLSTETVALTKGFDAISCFVNDQIDKYVFLFSCTKVERHALIDQVHLQHL